MTGDAVVKGVNVGTSQSSLVRTSTNHTQKGVGVGTSQSSHIRTSTDQTQHRLFNFITTHEKKINYIANGGASLVNLITFLNGNFHFLDPIQEHLETFSQIFTRCATGTQGFILSAKTCVMKNIVPFVGFALEIPIAILASGYDLYLLRGISQGLGQSLAMIDRREIVDNNGEPKPDNEGNIQQIKGDFKDRGWWKSVTTISKEIPKLIRELFEKPARIKKISHGLFAASTFQILGAIIGLCGFKKIGSLIRNTAGTGVNLAFMRDNNTNDKRGFNIASPLVQAGLTWMGADITDFFKRFEFISDKLNNLTNLALFFDRGASMRLTSGYQSMEKK